ncbi:class I SAM-dependent DNA methyltransferase [Staphylococcus epidermidis]|nr:DNA methyltransferase [Staphylococcus sp. HMSC077D08]MBM6184269.1 class I SAM-dependent DNA methyltransferase [Staphylococcus epidermidis]MBM6197364.1 class I SAM-dependent DNA methyltransferase [Staphylococcus epidermidis]MCG1177657.1 N-6 DNA methylase [Staphylococcus epidermidis]MCG2300275.1 N-6 DNA methylase [Staphylococcus epidermidis]OHQ95944.1 hypothetical protein HMPREF2663_08320 [Staphylococcus sp. HMSC077D08]
MDKEILNNCYKFLKLHLGDSDEKQQAQMWIRDFLEIFDIPKQKINIGFEWRINIDGSQKYADHLLNGLLLIEMKSKGIKLDKAKSQAYRYVINLDKEDIPKFIILSNFERIQLLDLVNPQKSIDIRVKDLPKYIENFNFLQNKVSEVYIPSNPVNEKAAKMMERLHNNLIKMSYPKNASDLLMTRIVFCLFAEDSGIFNRNQFINYIVNETNENGSDLVDKLSALFQVLNTPENKRFQNDVLNKFPYVNGGLFKVIQPSGLSLNSEIRNNLIQTATLDWSKISPVIFGSMFEGAMDRSRRHSLGAHYTSELNIMKIVNGLFLNDLREEFENIIKIKTHDIKISKLEAFHDKLSKLKFLDPACGSGNFLIVAYRELRRLEHEVLDEINQGQTILFDITDYIKVDINQFYGFEIVPYAVSVAKIGLWIMDHLMNIEASNLFGRAFLRLPLHASGNLYAVNALTNDWEELVPTKELSYILGNPPFIGARLMSNEQKDSFLKVMNFKNSGNLDFVSAWYYKTALLMQKNKNIKAALVSTNSIFQGEQASILWSILFEMGIHINFAHQTFKWDNNGAIVHVCIAGFSLINDKNKTITSYYDNYSKTKRIKVKNINEYLTDAPIANVRKRSSQISNMPVMNFGSMANDNGHFILNNKEKEELIDTYPEITDFIYSFIGSKEYLRNEQRYILYLKDINIKTLRSNPNIKKRVQQVQEYRLTSKRKKTRELANIPTLLGEDRVSFSNKLIIPRVSSTNRPYMPIGFVNKYTIISDSAFQLVNADLYIFGVLQSKMHTIWVKSVAGRLKSDIRYSNTLVYNTFVFPKVTHKQKNYIKDLSRNLLKIRHDLLDKGNSIADLYDKLFMPIELQNAHKKLDNAIEYLYRKEPFRDDNDRLAFLIKLYKNL